MQSILKDTGIQRAGNAAAAATSTITGTTIEMAQYPDGIAFVALLGTLTSTNVTTLKVQQGDASNGSDAADITGASAASVDTMSNKLLVVEVKAVTKKYVRFVITRATANAVIDGVLAVPWGVRLAPHTADTTIGASALVAA
jgi:hypothetical protein